MELLLFDVENTPVNPRCSPQLLRVIIAIIVIIRIDGDGVVVGSVVVSYLDTPESLPIPPL